MANSIFVGPVGEQPIYAEGLAATGFGCGYLVQRDTANTLTLSTKASTVFGQELLISAESGQTSGVGVADTYTAGDTARALKPSSGQLFYARFATGNNVSALGKPVTSAGAAGRFKLAATDGTDFIFATAEQIINVTADDTLVLCRAV